MTTMPSFPLMKAVHVLTRRQTLQQGRYRFSVACKNFGQKLAIFTMITAYCVKQGTYYAIIIIAMVTALPTFHLQAENYSVPSKNWQFLNLIIDTGGALL